MTLALGKGRSGADQDSRRTRVPLRVRRRVFRWPLCGRPAGEGHPASIGPRYAAGCHPGARFALPAEVEGSAFVSFAGALDDILCVQEERTVSNDNTVRYKRRLLQLPADRHRRHYVKATVRVHEYPDGTLAVFHGPRCLARYKAGGEPIDTSTRQAA